jgi:hypothetical protein
LTTCQIVSKRFKLFQSESNEQNARIRAIRYAGSQPVATVDNALNGTVLALGDETTGHPPDGNRRRAAANARPEIGQWLSKDGPETGHRLDRARRGEDAGGRVWATLLGRATGGKPVSHTWQLRVQTRSRRAVFHVRSLESLADVVIPAEGPPVVLKDPDDDPVLYTAIAIAGQSDVLCTADRHFYEPDVLSFCSRHGIQIMDDVDLLHVLRQDL